MKYRIVNWPNNLKGIPLFLALSDASKGHFLCLLALADGNNGVIPIDPSYLPVMFNFDEDFDFEQMVEFGLIEKVKDEGGAEDVN